MRLSMDEMMNGLKDFGSLIDQLYVECDRLKKENSMLSIKARDLESRISGGVGIKK